MSLRSSPGKKFPVHVEVPRSDEVAVGMLAPTEANAGDERDGGGRFRKGSRTAQAAGGRARKYRTKATTACGIDVRNVPDAFQRHLDTWSDWARVTGAYFASEVCGGRPLPPDAGAHLSQAALFYAKSRYLMEIGGDDDLAKSFGQEARQNAIAARDVCAKDAAAASRPRRRARTIHAAVTSGGDL